MDTAAEKLIDLVRSKWLIRTRDLLPLGITRVSLTRAVRRGQLECLGRGLQGLPGRAVSAHGTLAEVARRVSGFPSMNQKNINQARYSCVMPKFAIKNGTRKMKNQVSPDGSLITAPTGSRGLLMGNRGELKPRHYETAQPFAKKPWIACVFKDKNGTPYPKLSDLKYTKLFMLDEVTAFAAGHRPCGQCQKRRYIQFIEIWCKANRKDNSILDKYLHSERLDATHDGARPLHQYRFGELPNGVMVKLAIDGQPHLLLWGKLFPWTVGGYERPITCSPDTNLLAITPPSIIKALQAGFPLLLNSETTVHPSVTAYL